MRIQCKKANTDPKLLSHRDPNLSIIQIRISDISKLEFLAKGSRDIPLYQQPLSNVSNNVLQRKGNKEIKPIK